MRYTWIWLIVFGLIASVAPFSTVQAQGLSGSKGKMRAMGDYPREGCAKFFKQYIAASGHSAYATTVTGQGSAVICAVVLNRKSQAQAERDAIKACEDGDNYYKVQQLGGCYVGASK